MDKTKLLMPSAASILQSMRDIGYTLDTAVADIIDNSIAASATKVELVFLTKPLLRFLIIDNGTGMSSDELHLALKFAAKSPVETRKDEDLGRFGLGLKTASFSQARKITVITSQNNQLCAAQWDLDYIVQEDQWLLKIIEINDIGLDEEYLNKIKEHGTIVMWENIDRISFHEDEKVIQRYINQTLSKLRDHLGLVFHKFIEGKAKAHKLSISLNNLPIEAFNPFCISNSFTLTHPKEKIFIEDTEVAMQAYILPHYSKMSKDEYELFKEKSDLLNSQGAYVFRNDRLMVWGDWFRVISKSENTKYARVEINFDKKIDQLWTIDIKKSKAVPPYEVLDRLKQVIGKISTASVKLSTKRINKSLATDESAWNRFSGDFIGYKINKNYPIYQNLVQSMTSIQLTNFQTFMEILESSLPVQSIYSDMAVNPKQVVLQETVDSEKLYEKFLSFAEMMEAKNMDKNMFKQAAISTGLFDENTKDFNNWIENFYA